MVETKSIKDIRQPAEVRDIIKDKSGKLAAAVYLVTNFLDDSDQIKWKLRRMAIDLKDNLTPNVNPPTGGPTPNVWPVEIILSDMGEIISLIDIAALDRQASAMNFSILRQGYVGLQTELQNYINGGWYKSFLQISQISLPPKTANSSPELEVGLPIGSPTSNSVRREKIISFIKQHNWSSIKEIASFIPNVSSKTVQRELAELVRIGKLKKTGERRWSRYSPI